MREISQTAAVSVAGGLIAGEDLGQFRRYLGVPYAAPPTGDLRWRAPQPPLPWDGVRVCDSFAPSPIQAEQKPFLMWTEEFIVRNVGYSEDCLYLNIWAPKEAEGAPVLVFLHGGNLVSGGSSCEVYDGEELAKRGVVYVSVGFRVGVFGLLASSALSAESGSSGNWMLRDQIAALGWIRDHIRAFGGDPDNVTLSGLSTGAGNVHALCVSPLAKGLFHRVFAMSFCVWGLYDNLFGFAPLSDMEAAGDDLFAGRSLAEMRAVPAGELQKLPFTSRMCLDGTVLDLPYADGLLVHRTDDLEMVWGMVRQDGLILRMIPFPLPATSEGSDAAIREWFGQEEASAKALYPRTWEEPRAEMLHMLHDAQLATYLTFAELRRSLKTKPTYVYDFTYVMPGGERERYGAFHSSDMPYFWNVFSDVRKEDWTGLDRSLGLELCGRLCAFAAAGSMGDGPEWAPAAEGRFTAIREDGTICREEQDPRILRFWRQMMERKHVHGV